MECGPAITSATNPAPEPLGVMDELGTYEFLYVYAIDREGNESKYMASGEVQNVAGLTSHSLGVPDMVVEPAFNFSESFAGPSPGWDQSNWQTQVSEGGNITWNSGASFVTLSRSAGSPGITELIIPQQLSDGSMDIRLRAITTTSGQVDIGWSNNFSPGISSVYLNARNGQGVWHLNTSSNGGNSETSVYSAGSNDLENWHVYRIEWSDGAVDWYRDGVLLTTEYNNVPNGVSIPFRIRVSSAASAGSVSVDVDYVNITGN